MVACSTSETAVELADRHEQMVLLHPLGYKESWIFHTLRYSYAMIVYLLRNGYRMIDTLIMDLEKFFVSRFGQASSTPPEVQPNKLCLDQP
jgi:hypothetical protein